MTSRQHVPHPNNSIGMAWRPDSTGHKAVQFREIAFWHRFSPVQEACDTC